MGRSATRLRRLAVACVVAGGVLLLTGQPGATQILGNAGVPKACRALPTERETAWCGRAVQVLKADPYLERLLAGHPFAVTSAVNWDDPDSWPMGPDMTHGAKVTLRLSKPLNVAKTTLPDTYVAPGPGAYLLRPSPPVAIHNATTLTVFVATYYRHVVRVEFPRRAVIGLVAGAGAIPITRFGVSLRMGTIAAGADGNIWGTAGTQVVRLMPGPSFAVTGPDASLWFPLVHEVAK